MALHRRSPPPGRAIRSTLLLIGEGLAEQTFLRHMVALYVRRGNKAVTVRNAKGKGGGHVLAYALAQSKTADYDAVAAMLDTDQDWDDARRAQARRAAIDVFESTPCLEAWLLGIAGQLPPASTAACKREFARRFGHEAHHEALYPRHFAQDVLDAARQRIPELDRLIRRLTE